MVRIAVVLNTLPDPRSGGTGSHLLGWTILESLAQAGHHVELGVWQRDSRAHQSPVAAARLGQIRDLGVGVHILPDHRTPRVKRGRVRGLGAIRGAMDLARVTLRPEMSDFFPKAPHTSAMRQFLAETRPDVLVGYALGSLAPAHGQTTPPRVAVMVDLPHLVTRYRWQSTSPHEARRWLRGALSTYSSVKQRDWTLRLLGECASVVETAAHHAEWLRTHGVPRCKYLPMPTPDLAGGALSQPTATLANGARRPRLLLVGNLRGAATRPGLYLLAREVLPQLEHHLGTEGFEVHIVGKFSPPDDLREALDRPSVRLRGFVEDIGDEFRAADVLFVPTPLKLGTRTRIIVGASFAKCMVAHPANVLGIPEFRHGANILLGDTGPELARQVVRALRDTQLRRALGVGARRTFEEHFHVAIAGPRLAAEVERVAALGALAPSPVGVPS